MRIIIEIQCDNAAFGETQTECGEELQRILNQLGERMASDGCHDISKRIIDANGNHVGDFRIE